MNIDYLADLNEVQRDAVTQTEGPVLVVAGPGSGKTRVLTFRISYLLSKGVPPESILALTFTNKAAREMKSRIEQVAGKEATKIWAGTFHSIFSKILRIESAKIGYTPNFTIYDSEDTKNMLAGIVKELNLDKETYSPNYLRSRISSAKSNLITPLLYAKNQELITQDKIASRPRTGEIYQLYANRCKRSDAMDFDDLLYRTYELFQSNPDQILEKYRNKFKYVLVDEFQDTNHLQYAIVKKLTHYEGSLRNICVVGDDAQSIYGFRGATIRNILDFENDFQSFGIKVFKLEQNYRSTDHIVQAANEVILHNKRQIQKKIWSDKGSGEKIKLIKALADSEEGKRIVDMVLEQKNRNHLKNKDFAILYRTNAQSRIFEEYLRRYNIPYKVYGGQSFYQRKEIKDLIAYLRMAVNPRDDEAFKRIINFPKRNIGDTTIQKIITLAGEQQIPLWDALKTSSFSGKTGQSLLDFIKMIENFNAKVPHINAYDLGLFIGNYSGLIQHYRLDTTPEGTGRTENLTALLDGIKIFVEEDSVTEMEEYKDKSLTSYLQNIALITDLDTDQADGDHVTLMSIHSAKGLEFPSVFIVGLEENLFPSFLSMEKPEDIDEERRLFYVAITRAEKFLTLSYASSRYKFGQIRYNEPSRFLEEIEPDHFDQHAEIKPTATVSGFFKKPIATPLIDPATFKPSPSHLIKTGIEVLHLKFGKGLVKKIDGGPDNRVATIYFDEIDQPEKRIMLKFAKLQIL
jgi:DNA helicase II / ATP-dependent DNA helicase PcrA